MARVKEPEPTLVYVLQFLNPFEKSNEEFLSKDISVLEAEEKFLRIYKTSSSDSDTNVIPSIFSEKIPWLKEAQRAIEDEKRSEKIYMREFFLAVISSLLYSIENELKLKYFLLTSRDKDEIFVKIFVTEAWLIEKAVKEKYKLQLRQTFNDETLNKLKFMQVPPFVSSDLIEIKNNLELFKRYNKDGEEESEGTSGSLFLYSDKSRLVINALNSRFDLTSLKKYEIMLDHYCVHQANPLKYLQYHWARLGAIFKKQPLNHIRNYYSEKVAVYFAWIGTYCEFMLIAAVVGIAFELGVWFLEEDSFIRDYLLIGFSIFLTFWASTFDQFWIRKEKFLAWKWGTLNLNEIEAQRADYKGVFKKDEVTGKMKVIEKGGMVKFFRIILSYSFILVLIFCVIGAVWSIFFIRKLMFQEFGQGLIIKMIPGLLNAIQIKIMNIFYGKLAVFLNNWENHETDNNYNDHLAVKLFMFKFVNSYSSLLYIAFFSSPGMCKPNCVEHLSVQLMMIFFTNLLMNLVELGLPWFTIYRKLRAEKKKIREAKKSDDKIREFMYPVEKESKLGEYESPLDDYMEMVIQFGYVALFGASLPIISFLALIEIILEIRVDAWKLSYLTKRPSPARSENIGVWRSILIIVTYAGAFTNSGIIFITMNLYEDNFQKILGFLIIEHVMLFGMKFIEIIIPDVPSVVSDGKMWSDRISTEIMLEGIANEKKQAEFNISKGTEPFWLEPKDIHY